MPPYAKAHSREEKIESAIKRIPDSTLFMRMKPRSVREWAGILSELGEDKIDDLLLLLEKEGTVFAGGRDAELWELQKADRSEYLERLEELKIAMEKITDNPTGDDA